MKRDMELCRLILFKIEEEYKSNAIFNISISGYDSEEIAYHCNLLFNFGLISSYQATYADNSLHVFSVGSLTWEGHDFLDKIREDTVWNSTKKKIKENMLPMTLDVIKSISASVISAMLKDAMS
ncbi:DUF2513 domain-containing protein [Streptococcus cristatus]|uniref:DUF2513 domain-containing protein n=1 Tax=Streptococcus cristatus TaxID=45634 RepID=UPI0039C1FD5E